jgi:hypothetical protein
MKKSLVTLLALVFVLSIGASALAAGNPFVDVPTTSWAYGAINKLVAAGVIDGYGDGTFHGDKAMTRYEAAQMVAKAMAKEDMATAENKALIDKLAVEFATELNNLGVRVAKLEAGASSIKFSGDARVRYNEQYTAAHASNDYMRFRLNMVSQVNDTTTFNGRIGTVQTAFGSNPYLQLIDMNLVSKNVFGSGVALTLGRQDVAVGPSTYFLWTTGFVDAAKAAIAVDKGSLEVGYGDFGLINVTPTTVSATADNGFDKAVWANFKYPLGSAIAFSAGYFADQAGLSATAGSTVLKVTDIGLVAPLSGVTAPHAYVVRLAYKAVNPKVAGSWGAFVEYYNCQNGATNTLAVSDVQTGNIVNFQNNQKAVDLVAQFALAQNITLDAIQTFSTASSSTGAQIGNYTRFNVNYMF